MRFPTPDDTIVAVSTGWSPAAMGIVRLSGSQANALAESLLVPDPVDRQVAHRRMRVGDYTTPVTVVRFRAPRSYTGQDVVEIHAPGCLPLLSDAVERLVRAGARQALPGEFTARAYLLGKLTSKQVTHIEEQLSGAAWAHGQRESRMRASQAASVLDSVEDQLTDLLARFEAGIDFSEEEDVQFISDAELIGALDAAEADLRRVQSASRSASRGQSPHVCLAGCANAGKSTLFNALVRQSRSLVSGQPGTTRDALECELDGPAGPYVLQDCAGFGDFAEEVDLAAFRLAQRVAASADVLLWVHDVSAPWTTTELQWLSDLQARLCLIILSKADLSTAGPVPAGIIGEVLEVSAATGMGLDRLRDRLGQKLASLPPAEFAAEGIDVALEAIERARELVKQGIGGQEALVSLEIRLALASLQDREPSPDAVLGRIYGRFCIGK